MAFNKTRAERMKKKSVKDLEGLIVRVDADGMCKRGTLSSAAAQYELDHRNAATQTKGN